MKVGDDEVEPDVEASMGNLAAILAVFCLERMVEMAMVCREELAMVCQEELAMVCQEEVAMVCREEVAMVCLERRELMVCQE